MNKPSIKGIVIADVAANVRRLLEKGRIAPGQLEEEDLAFLETKIQPAVWYCIYQFERLMQAMADAEAGDDREGYFRRTGRIMAERLQELGLYPQLERGDEGADGPLGALNEHVIKRTLSLWNVMVNFSVCRGRLETADSPAFWVEVDDAEDYVSVLRMANAGFMEGVFGHLAGSPVSVEIDKDEPAHIAYRIQLA